MSEVQTILSPCIGVCTLDADGYCVGCLRTMGEIGAWRSYSDAERLRFIREILPRREAEHGLCR